MSIDKEIKVFIVDDNRVFALALKAYITTAFEKRFIKVFSFETGEKCMERFAQETPEMVILDYSLNSRFDGAANGLKILEKIKKINSKTSVIMLTSNDQINTALESFHHGASDYVVKNEKPFEKINQSICRIFAEREHAFQKKENEKSNVEKIIAGKELHFQNEDKKKRAAELIITTKEREFQDKEISKRMEELKNVTIQIEEAVKSRRIVEEKNKEITDSIYYAKRIQLAKFPKKENIFAALPQSFVLFKPKDIVSGDFYYFTRNKHTVFIVAADCTGHGVPGALMSMIGSEKLADAVALTEDTSEILQYLNKGIKNSLQQTNSMDSTRDGMDIAICSVNTESRVVKFSGANRPLWVIRKGQASVEVIKGTKMAIGGFTEEDQYFESHELRLQQGDTFYLATDGYADQFGGVNGKKLMSKKMKEILLAVQHKSMKDQKIYLDDFIENWKVRTEQVDDILVIGVRL
jgi:serine phosphatase RsbU (regulator of sigma subunit)